MNGSTILKLFCIMLFTSVISFSCVSTKKYQLLESENAKAKKENTKLLTENNECNIELTEFKSDNNRLNNKLKHTDSILFELRKEHAINVEDLKNLKESYSKIDSKYKTTISGKTQLEKVLNQREKELLEKENIILSKELLIKEKEELIAEKEILITKKEADVEYLKNLIQKSQSEMLALKEKVAGALLGFENKGLSVHIKEGKVYVSISEQLLFASGSWNVNPKGREALAMVSDLLAQNKDIHVLVEGHTDNVPYRGKGVIKDNWDLSVLRATSVVKVILSNKNVNPANISAAGRGEYVPLAENSDAANKAKNRRTEIILIPNLNEIFEILGKNE